MARLSTNGIAELCADLTGLGDSAGELLKEMLNAEAGIVQEAQRKTAKSMGVYDESGRNIGGHMADSITVGNRVYKSADGAVQYVYPKGSRRRKNSTSSNAEIAFINEFGKQGQPPRPFIRTANEASAEKAVEAAEKVSDNFLRTKNL